MIVTCDECGTSFNFDEKMIKPTGSKVRCSKCQSIFTAYPPAVAPQTTRDEADQTDAASVTGSLEDLDLDEIEKELELDFEDTDEIDSAEDSEFDFQFDEEDTEEVAVEAVQDELDFSDLGLEEGKAESEEYDLDPDPDSGAGTQEEVPQSDADEEFDFDLDLGEEADPEPSRSTGEATNAPDFDLGLELEDTKEIEEEAAASDENRDVDFDLDFGLDDDQSTGSDDRTDDDAEGFGSLSLDLDEDDGSDGGGIDFEETTALEMPVKDTGAAAVSTDELGFSLDLEDDDQASKAAGGEDAAFELEETSAEATSDLSTDDLDFSLDLDGGTAELQDDSGPKDSEQPVDFELDLDFDGRKEDDDLPTSGAAKVEETNGIDLADLEEMIEDSPDADGEDLQAEDAELEPFEEDEPGGSADSSAESEELDLSGLEDEFENGQDEGGVLEEDDLSDLLEIEPDSDEGADDLDFELEPEGPASDARAADSDSAEDEEDFNLSDLDDLLELDEENSGDGEQDQDFDLELDFEETSGAAADDDEFEAGEAQPVVEPTPLDEAVVEQSESGFDLGMLEEGDADVSEGDEVPAAAAKKRRPGIGGFFKFLLVILLLGGGGYAAVYLTQYFGVEIPYMDTVKDSIRKVPYVGEFLGPAVEDSGNLKFAIPEDDVNGYFVQNNNLGQLYVIEGRVRNMYDDPRRFVRITGKLYAKDRQLKHEKTVFAGNVLTEKELTGLDGSTIDKMLGNRFGRDKANLEIEQGGTIPFMLVFSKLASNLDEYTVEVADSAAVKQ